MVTDLEWDKEAADRRFLDELVGRIWVACLVGLIDWRDAELLDRVLREAVTLRPAGETVH